MHIVIGLLIAFLLVMLLSNRKTRQCKWRADRSRDQNGMSFYHCMVCGEICFTNDGKPPKICQTEVPPPSL